MSLGMNRTNDEIRVTNRIRELFVNSLLIILKKTQRCGTL